MKKLSKTVILFLSFIVFSAIWAHAELKVGQIYNVLDEVILRKAPDENAERLLNEKLIRFDPENIDYYLIDNSNTVRMEEIKGDWVRVQLVTPPRYKETHKGWVPSRYIDDGESLTPFLNPKECIKIPLKLGLKPAEGVPMGWASGATGWRNCTKIITFRGNSSGANDVDNEILCDIESKTKDTVEQMVIRANCFNLKGEEVTLSRFKSVVKGLLNELGESQTASELSSIPPAKNIKVDKTTYTIEFRKEPFSIGFSWVFTIKTK